MTAADPRILNETADRAGLSVTGVRPQTLTSLAAHLDARAAAILRPDSEAYAEWQSVVAELRRAARHTVDVTPDEPDPTLLAELRQHLADHTPSCNARTDHLMRRATAVLGAVAEERAVTP
jgi:hypothetical protein